MNASQRDEDEAVRELIPIIKELMNSSKISFVLQSKGIFDTSRGNWAVVRALTKVLDDEYELATK